MNPSMEDAYDDNHVVARRQAAGFPGLPDGIEQYTAYLYIEMWQCYLNGLDHAAVLTACALVQSATKDAIYFDKFVKADCEFDSKTWDEIDNKQPGDANNLAKRLGIVKKADWKRLEWVREHFRKPYLHGSTPDWLKDGTAPIVEGELSSGTARLRTVSLRENRVVQQQLRIIGDRQACNELIPEVDSLVRLMIENSNKKYAVWKAANPSRPTKAQVDRVLENMKKQGLEVDRIILNELPIDSPPDSQAEASEE